jgi:hypothetical protein
MMAIAATEVQDDIAGPGPGQVSHKREPIFEQPLRMTVLLGRTGRGTSIEERPDVGGVVRGSGCDTAKSRPMRSSFRCR